MDYKYKYLKYKQKYLSLKGGFDINEPISFAEEFDRRSEIIFGENYAAEYTTGAVGDLRVAYFFKIVRNLTFEDVKNFQRDIIKLYNKTDDINLILDLFTLVFQSRDARGGKGEKKIFYYMLIDLFTYYPTTVMNVLALIPFYGYYKDYPLLIETLHKLSENTEHYNGMITKVYDYMITQLKKDIEEYYKSIIEKRKPDISLLAKYIPKEGKHFDKKYNMAENLAIKMNENDDINTAKMNYRKVITKLTNALDIPEIKMSANKYSEINFSKITSKCVFKYRKAFLNEIVKKSDERCDLEDRRKCRENFINAIREDKISGKQTEPYEIVKVVQNAGQGEMSKEEINLLQTIWNDLKNNVIKMMHENKSNNDIKLGNIVPIIDVSGSMEGVPMYVAVSLGILLSELNQEPYKNRLITFSATPNWTKLDTTDNIVAKIDTTLKMDWGTNTNFELVYEMILDVIKTLKLKQNEIPDLIVFSDMQFDQASVSKDKWETHHQKIVRRFEEVGMEIHGKPYHPPKIIYWNLRADTIGFPVQADTPNVQMLSGFSPNLFKHILSGKDFSEFEIPSPYSILRNILDDDRYNIVRQIVMQSGEITNEKIENINIC